MAYHHWLPEFSDCAPVSMDAFHRHLELRTKYPDFRMECGAMESFLDNVLDIQFNTWRPVQDWKYNVNTTRRTARLACSLGICDSVTSIFVDHTAGRYPCLVQLDIGGNREYANISVKPKTHMVREFGTSPVCPPGFMYISVHAEACWNDAVPRVWVRTQARYPPDGSQRYMNQYFDENHTTYVFFPATPMVCTKYIDGVFGCVVGAPSPSYIDTVEELRAALRKLPRGKQIHPFYKWVSSEELNNLSNTEYPQLVSSLYVFNPQPYSIELSLSRPYHHHSYLVPPGPHVVELFWSEMFLRGDFRVPTTSSAVMVISVRVGWIPEDSTSHGHVDIYVHLQENIHNPRDYHGTVYNSRGVLNTRIQSPAASQTRLTWLWAAKAGCRKQQQHPFYDFRLVINIAEYL